jgi:hypothetical protein
LALKDVGNDRIHGNLSIETNPLLDCRFRSFSQGKKKIRRLARNIVSRRRLLLSP